MKKSIRIFILMVAAFIISFGSIKAAPTYTTKAGSFPNKLTHVFLGSWSDGLIRYDNVQLYYKYTDKQNQSLVCTNFDQDNKGLSGSYAKNDCTKITGKNPLTKVTDWSSDPAVASGVAAIIIQGSGGLNKTLSVKNYHLSELAVNTYLRTAKSGKYSYVSGTKTRLNRSFSGVNGVSTLTGYGKDAQTAYTKFSSAKMGVTIGKFKCTGTTCKAKVTLTSGLDKKYNKDTNFQSKVTFTNTSLTISGMDNSNVSYRDNVITVTNVPKTSETKTYKVTATFQANRNYYVAQNYSCGSNNQTLTPNIFEKKTQSKTKKASSSFTIKGISSSSTSLDEVIIDNPYYWLYKVSSIDGTPLTGATLRYNSDSETGTVVSKAMNTYDDDDTTNGERIPYLFDANTSMYNITETTLPQGYKMTSSMPKNIVIEKDSNGNISRATITYYDGTTKTLESNAEDGSGIEAGIEMPNAPDTSLTILKIDGNTKKSLAGSTLALYEGGDILHWDYVNENGVVVTEPVADTNGNYLAKLNDDGAHTSWVTSEYGMKFIELAYDVEYDIVESSAPTNYIINNDVTTATLTNESDATRHITKTIENYPSTVTISKQDITSKKELPGAQLKIIDGQGNVYDSWTSTDKPHIINTLKDGTYYLQETTAPSGYALNTETIEFSVVNGKTQTEVVMYNTPSKITVANTLLGKNIVTYVVGGMLILIGLGVLYYELKQKKVSK